MDERLRFVARLLEGEQMAPLCAEFGISRKTGYKIFNRYKDCGVGAFTDRSRRAYRQANRLPAQLEAVIVRLKHDYPGWGAPKIREKLRQQFPIPHLPGRLAPSTRCSIVTAWSIAGAGGATAPLARGCRSPPSRMCCGAPTTKVNSCSPIGDIAIR
jgi:hypothetical protein